VSEPDRAQRRSLFQLIGELPGLVAELIRAEIDALKAELKSKAIRAAVGLALMIAALFVLLCAIAVGIFAGIAGIATVLPWWASALIVFGGLVVLALVLVALGVGAFKSMQGSNAVARIREDVESLGSVARHAARERRAGGARE